MSKVTATLQAPVQTVRPTIPGNVLEGRTVILAEDDELNRIMLGDCLEGWGLTVLEAEGGRQVLAHLHNTSSVDLILMDMSMPGLNGLQTTQAIRSQNWAHQGVAILALTGNSDELVVRTALRAGMNGYIPKSGDMKLLQGKMIEVLTVAKQREESLALSV